VGGASYPQSAGRTSLIGLEITASAT